MTIDLFDCYGIANELGDATLPPGGNAAELQLARLATDLGAADIGGRLTRAESGLIEKARETGPSDIALVDATRAAILRGDDPLGVALCRIRPAATRRKMGAFYTQPALLSPMLDWALAQRPDRLIDPGCGSGRFAATAIRRSPDLTVIAIDVDPLATLLTRAALAVLGAGNATVLQADYTKVDLPRTRGRTAFIGNPPYVRHHDLSAAAKAWAVAAGKHLGHTVSALAGLHVHFFLATALYAQPGDVGCFVTSAEWLDVNYGSVVRNLLLDRLGGLSLDVIDPKAVPFQDAMTTAAIVCFEAGAAPEAVHVRLVDTPGGLVELAHGRAIVREALTRASRWTPLFSSGQTDGGDEHAVRLGAIAGVHRGVVTGANEFFVLSRQRAHALGIEAWCRPAITSAKEILQSDGVVRDSPERKLLLDVPAGVDRAAHPRLDAYLRLGERPRGDQPALSSRYIPRHRRPWWHLSPCPGPPIVASYMARQAPVFALNPDGLALINIAHGIYPKADLAPEQLAVLVGDLNASRASYRGRGRTYHGGLEKFEPREMESLAV